LALILTACRIARIDGRAGLIDLSWMVKGHVYGGICRHWISREVPGLLSTRLTDNSRLNEYCRLVPATGELGCSSFRREQQAKFVSEFGVLPREADIGRFQKVRD